MCKEIKTLIVLLFTAVTVSTSLKAQDHDFGIWYAFSLEHKITEKLSVGFDPIVRTNDNASQINKFYFEPSVSYDLSKYIEVAARYRLNRDIEDDGSYSSVHTWILEATGKKTFNNISIQIRSRFLQDISTGTEDNEVENLFRVRLKTAYNIPSTSLTPHLSSEFFMPLGDSDGIAVEKLRLIGGVKYKISDIHSFSIDYLNERRPITGKINNIIILCYYLTI